MRNGAGGGRNGAFHYILSMPHLIKLAQPTVTSAKLVLIIQITYDTDNNNKNNNLQASTFDGNLLTVLPLLLISTPTLN